MKRSGFTLVEVMIVVLIIVVLATIGIPNFIGYRKTAHAKACIENMAIIRDACRTYQINHSGAVTEDQSVLTRDGVVGLLRREIKCPIGGEYTIKYDTATGDFNITCSLADETEHNVANGESSK